MRQNVWRNTIVQNSREITRRLLNRQVILQMMLNLKTFRPFSSGVRGFVRWKGPEVNPVIPITGHLMSTPGTLRHRQ